MKHLRVLCVDDSEADVQLLLRELRKNFQIEHAQVWAADTLRAALAQPWDIVISDWSMPADFTGLVAFEIVRELGIDVPFIIVSGTIGEDIAVDALRAGVQDFMTKGRFARLLPTIERELREVEVRRRQREADAELVSKQLDVERSERLLRDVLESVPDAVVVTDAEGHLVLCNAVAREQLGAQDVKVGDRDWYRHIQRYQEDKITRIRPEETAVHRALRGEIVDRQQQFWPQLREGGGWVSVSARPLTDRGVVAVYRDMTRERASQEQLMMSDRMASIGMLAAGVAHEINNPLAAVLANIDLSVGLVDEIEPARIRGELGEMLGDALVAANRVRDIVRDLKLFSRHQEPETNAVELEAVLESTLRMAWNEIRHRAKLEKHFGTAPRVRGAESRLGQVFLNLIINAAQAIPEGKAAHNVIRVVTSTDDNGDAVVEISDTGSGMTPEVQRHLFTPFFTTKPRGVGTGLGLAISHRIVTNLGGSIEVESAIGRGTTFRIVLPASSDVAIPRTKSGSRPLAGKRARVLVVDDEALIVTAVARALAEHDITSRTSAADALELVRSGERFDVILCDLMMPEMTGMELYEQIRAVSPELAERMVFMTGDAFTEVARAFVATVRYYIDKPFEPRSLRALIAELVSESD